MKTNPNMMRTLKASNFYPTLFTNTALDKSNMEPWWEGLDGPVPQQLEDWQGKPWSPESNQKAAHPNSRFTVSIYNCPTLSREYDNPRGVPISAIIFGGRRSHLIPLVVEAFNWPHGVFMGARMGSETTAAATVQVGMLRRDPMAMLPFCGYNMGDYFRHWINMGRLIQHPPRIYSVNWFLRDEKGDFLWPGFGENIRVIKWIIDRVNNRVGARETPVGLLPHVKDMRWEGLDMPMGRAEKLFEFSPSEWGPELQDIKQSLDRYGRHIPYEMWNEYERLSRALSKSVI
jgi:phosphoenolpyruvate carboxykinase (GTP)